MESLPDLVHQSANHPLLFALTAVLLGALHGLEAGHSKTIMAAFIIAIRGTLITAMVKMSGGSVFPPELQGHQR